jgi:hypothetical protein
LYIARGFRKDPFTVNGVGRNRFRTKQLLSVLSDNTVKCQSIHQRVFACRPDIGINFVESQTNTPPDQLSEAQIFQNTSPGLALCCFLKGIVAIKMELASTMSPNTI